MVSLRFPFSFCQPSNRSIEPRILSTSAALGLGLGLGFGFTISYKNKNQEKNPFVQKALRFFSHNSLPLWGSLSLIDNAPEISREAKTGVEFPTVLKESQRLLGVGVRKKCLLGLKNIDVYAFGIYVDDNEFKVLLNEKYGMLSSSELKKNKAFYEDILEHDLSITVRLQIVYSRLSIRSVRSAFEESVGRRLGKFSKSDNKNLLQRFTSQFKDEYKIPRGSIIELSRERGHTLVTKIDGMEVGSIKSKPLCRSVLDLYIGEEPFDREAKDEVELSLASLLQK